MAKSLFLKAWSHCLAWDPRHLDIFGGHSRAFQLGTWFTPADSTRPGAGWEGNQLETKTQTSGVFFSAMCSVFLFNPQLLTALLWIWQHIHPSSHAEKHLGSWQFFTQQILAPGDLKEQEEGVVDKRKQPLTHTERRSPLTSCHSSGLFF